MAEETAVSGQETGNAGKGADPLADAVKAAFDDAGVEDDAYVPKVGDKPAKTEKPIDSTAPEDAAEGKPEAGKEPAEEKTEGTEGAKPNVAKADPAMATPAHWDAKTREAFGKLKDDEAKKAVLGIAKNLEAGFTRKSMELSGKAKFADNVLSLVTDEDRAVMRQNGIDETEGLRRVLHYNRFATKQPVQYARFFVSELIKRAGISLDQIFPEAFTGGQPQGQGKPAAGNGAQPQPQPRQADSLPPQLLEYLNSLHGEVSALKEERRRELTNQEQVQLTSAEDAISEFRDRRDDRGNPVYPFFDQVKETMTHLLTTDPSIQNIRNFGERLARAYDASVAITPELRTQSIEQEVKRRMADAGRLADVDKARRAKSPVSSPSTGSPSMRPSTPGEAVAATMRDLGL